jgi:hypothetical protein
MNATIKTIAMAPASSMANDFHFCAAMVRSLFQLLRQTHILAARVKFALDFLKSARNETEARRIAAAWFRSGATFTAIGVPTPVIPITD